MVSDVADFERDGYAVFEHIVTERECEQLVDALPAIDNSGSRVLLTLAPFQTLAQKLRSNANLSCFVGDLSAVQCILFRKSSAHNWAVSLHRDAVLPIRGHGPWPSAGSKEGAECAMPPREFMDRCVAVRLHLDGAPIEDVSVVPGSHTDGAAHSRASTRRIPVGKGGALIMRPTLAHASTKLQHGGYRRVLHYVFAPRELPHGHFWHSVA